jgi:hypothetical protein
VLATRRVLPAEAREERAEAFGGLAVDRQLALLPRRVDGDLRAFRAHDAGLLERLDPKLRDAVRGELQALLARVVAARLELELRFRARALGDRGLQQPPAELRRAVELESLLRSV